MSRSIYRIPTYILGPKVFMYAEVKDKQPWGLVERNIPDHWAETMGAGVTVAILDTGLWDHRDLPDPVFAENVTKSSTVADVQGHGTHVAGTVGARRNGAGVVGWAPECNLGCVKVLGDDGTGSGKGIAKGIRIAVDAGADIINMSLGGGYDLDIANACRDAIQQGVFVICAAGNEGNFTEINTMGYPAKLAETIAVASYQKNGEISPFSSSGEEVNIAFPGQEILSTWLRNSFRTISGTSMATPACCGLTSLMLAVHRKAEERGDLKTPIRNNSELAEHYRRHAQDMGAPGKDTSFGWGIPNVDGMVHDEGPQHPCEGAT